MLKQELIDYMKEDGFQRVVFAWIRQYQRLGRLGGTIHLYKLSSIEKEQLGGFLGKDLRACNELAIRWTQWDQVLKSSRYAAVDFFDVLTALYGRKILTKAEEKEIANQKDDEAICALLAEYKDTKAEAWLVWMQSKQHKSYQNVKQFLRSEETEKLRMVLSAVNALPIWQHENVMLPIFAASVTQDPHFFDKGNAANLLFQGICYFLDVKEKEYDLAERNKIWYDAGIIRDDLSNNCMLAHISAWRHSGKRHEGWQGFYESYEPWNVNLFNLQQIASVDACITCVYIVENPAVFRDLLLFGREHKKKEIGFLCTNGQLNLCSYVLLDMLQSQKIHMYYAGDFDPEGLLIADKLKARYGDDLTLWHYHASAYDTCMSNRSIDERRLAMLSRCETREVQEIAALVQKHRKSGYQELLLEQYKMDME